MAKTIRMAWILGAILAGIMLPAAGVQAEKLSPVDEGPRDRSFLAFRNRLIAAVKRRDLRFINSILDPHVISSFGDDPETVATFKRIYEGKNVRIRPSQTAPAVGTLSYDIVEVDQRGSVPPDSDSPTWVKVTTPSGRKGSVSGRYVRSPIDYRAGFRKRRSRWWLTALVAGD